MRRAELICGLVVAVVGAGALQMALELSMFNTQHAPGPGFFPTLLSGLLLGLGLLLAFTSARRSPDPAETERFGPDGELIDRRQARRHQLRAGIVWVCFAATVPLLSVLGFVPTMAILVFLLVFGVENRHNWRSIVAAIAIPVATSVIFVDLLGIPLPLGLLSTNSLGI
jgi:putative tricarboxylic transport membrane protein